MDAPQFNFKLRDVRLTLTTAAGRVGTCLLSSDDEMVWDRDGDDETVKAVFALIDPTCGEDGATVQIEGDEWRALEDSGMLDYVLYWARRAVSLDSAVQSAMAQEDPPGRDSEYEEALDEKNAEIARLLAMVNDLDQYLREIRAENVDGSEPALGELLDRSFTLRKEFA